MADDAKLLDYLKKVAAELHETRERLRKIEEGGQEPIAIVAMGCRFPGGVRGPEDLWELLARGGDAVSGFPEDRGWDIDALYDPDPEHAGTTYAREGAFVAGAAEFDAGFFGISPREALAMDPQQRLLLETSWETLERAGIDPRSLRGSKTGVFAGASYSGYAVGPADGAGGEGYTLTGGATSVISGRVSYTLGLEGPAVTVDTACSSSLVTLHLACQALRAGECSLALAGGVAVMVTPSALTEFSRQRGLAADGRCKAFAAAADGIGWSEGAGVVLLERLSDARRHGHPVLAVVTGSAVNQDGASNGLTAPNGPSQQRVIRAALANARISADQVDAVEAHGTGTVLGDPIEAQALLATYGPDRPADRPLWLGSVKSNIGHAQEAAGVAGIIKMVLALQHQVLPATLHADEPSPHVDWSAGAVRLLAEPVPWPAGDQPRRAGVSSFGISGTNAHAILEEPPAADDEIPMPEPTAPVLGPGPLAWLVSARTADGLAAQAGRLAAHLAARPELDPADVSWSLATTRSAFEHRAVITGGSRDELTAGLAAMAAGQPAAEVITGCAGDMGPTVFVFPGQGGQWAGMGRELAASSPVFAAKLAECAQALAPHIDWSLDDVLAGAPGAPALDRADVVQPALWAVMVSLAALWQAAGVTPDAVAGHSQGEIAAACVAGILSLEDAARIVALRSKALMALAGRGGMLSIAEPAAQVQARLARWDGRLAVAAVNGPAASVVSGDPEALAELAAECAAHGVRTKTLPVDYASHGAQVDELRDEILTVLDGITPGPARIPMVSALTGELLAGPEAGAGYWFDSLRQPVAFDRAVRVLAAAGHRAFIEVSPHPVLTAAITETLDDAATSVPTVTGTLRRDDGGPARFLACLAEAHVHGAAVDWAAVLPAGQRIDLPTYAFSRQRYWPGPAAVPAEVAVALGLGSAGHPLLGAAVELAAGEGLVLTGRLSVRSQPWLGDHAVAGTVLLPGTAFVELAVHAGDLAGCGRVEELTLDTPLVLPSDSTVQVQVTVNGPGEDGRRAVEVYSRAGDAEGPWTRHASGLLSQAIPPAAEPAGDFAVWPPRDAVPVEVAGWYEALAVGGYGYGPAFRGLRAAWRRGEDVFAEVALPEEAAADAGSFGVHPALLDAALHAAGLAAPGTAADDTVRMPFAWTGVSLHATGASALRVRLRTAARGTLSLTAADAAGLPVVSVDGLVTRPAAGQLEAAGGGPRDALFSVEWVPIPAAGADPAVPGRWAVVGDDRLGLAAGAPVSAYRDLAELAAAIEAGHPEPEVVLTCAGSQAAGVAEAARAAAAQALELLQDWLAEERLASSRLVVVTRGAVAAESGEGVSDLAGAAVWGLVRSAQSENPGRLVLADLPGPDQTGPDQTGPDQTGPDQTGALAVLAAALSSGEPELVIRDQAAYGRRLARPADGLVPPAGEGSWRLDSTERGSLPALALLPCLEAAAPLEEGQVRIAVRAAGLNFRDVLIALDMYPGAGVMGSEVAGIVAETGPGVTGLAAGDRVMGLAGGGFGPVAVTDARLLARIPAGWSFAEAAAVPVAFTTAWYALAELAGARAGQRLLVHAAAGGVGMAAVTIARHLGLEVFGTASPGKHAVLAGLGLDQDHVASSRTAEFEDRFLAATGGAGMDIVLNALAGELTDASLRLLLRGGAFIEMGKTDVRDPAAIARDHDGVAYRAFELAEMDPERLGSILAQVTGLLAAGELHPAPVRAWDVRRAPEAFRLMSQARHTGKLVLTVPPDPAAPRDAGTMLITGGTGTLAGLIARHLARTGRARHLVLASRSGPAAPAAAALAADLAAAGTGVQVTACDAADRDALAGLLTRVRADRPLTGVIHAAGMLDDGVTESLTAARVQAVMRPKADAAWHLHELTQDAALDSFVLFSSGAATFGSPGQGNYAAANAFLDALAARRRAAGLPAVSLAWGLWADASGMTGHLSQGDRARMARGGAAELSAAEGLALLDVAAGRDEALLVPIRLDVAALRAWAARAGTADVPALLRGLIRGSARPSAARAEMNRGAGSLRQQLAGRPTPDQARLLVDLVRLHVAAVLGHASAEAIEVSRAFTDLGFDSLTAVELRNRLNTATGLRLPATLVFDYPTPTVLADHLRAGLVEDAGGAPLPPEVKAAAGEPVAVVAMSCRFPGRVSSPEELWELLAAGGDAISGFPADRGWDTDGLYDPDPDHAGTSYVRAGGFVDDAAGFDPGFFGISPREALAMDPQQRLLLETSWEALERAGLDPGLLRGSPTGVFVGASSSGYGADLPGLEGHLLTGTAASVMSGRVAYTLGLEGPAVTVDTACSSSLVALHLACQALRAGECHLALAGGVTVMTSPDGFVGFSRQRGLAADGRCKPFSAAADGMGMAEGAGMLVVERLSDARRNGHRVLAVVRGSAVNQDGASNGLTAPNGPSQQRVIRAALASAKLTADQVDAVEAHGTGTELGDPIEAQALLATYGHDRPADRPLWLGSVKSNLGHTQAAAGVAGIIKMVLALRHGQLPATLHAAEPSPHVDWSAGAVRLLAELVPWPAGDHPRRAGVSSFGFSGTNAHAILEEPPATDGETPAQEPAAPVLGPGPLAWLVSARTAEGMAAQAERLATHLAARPDLDPADVGWSLATTRAAFEHRAVITGSSREELAAGLAAVAAGSPAAGVVSGVAGDTGQTVFVFPGQGGQWAGMGRELAVSSPVFAAKLAECGRALAPHVDWSLDDVLAGIDGAPGLDRVDVVQPVLWAVMVSLAAVWQAARVTPDAVAGHSQGEIAAACVAGILSLEDAARIVALRSKALVALAGRGGMLSVAEPGAQVRDRLACWGGRLSVAAVNGPAATVVSGDLAALEELAALCAGQDVRTKTLPVDYASHGAQVDELREEILAALDGITPGPGQIPMVSALTGELLAGPEAGPGYWYDSLRQPVAFDQAVRVLAETGHRTFIEVSPHPVLVAALTETLEEVAGTAEAAGPVPVVTGTLRRDDGGPARFLASLAEVHVHGARVDWAAVLGGGQRVDLPTYAFEHQRFWPAPAALPVGAAGADGASLAAEARFWAAVEGGDLQALSRTLAVDGRQPLEEVLPALAAWRRRELDQSVVAGWRYRVRWTPAGDLAAGTLSGTWLVVVPAGLAGGDLAAGCARAMAAHGARVAIAEAGAGELDRTVLKARIGRALAEPEDVQAEIGAAVSGVSGVSGVVSLLGLDEAPVPGFAVVPGGLAGTLALLQALGDAGITAPLWVLTCGAVAAGPDEGLASPVQAQVQGLGRTAGMEYPDRWGGLIDVPPVLDERAGSWLCSVLAGCGEEEVAIRGTGVLARRLVRAPAPRAGRGWVPRGTALVTGGTGAIGGHVARWLAAAGVPRVVLASRSGPGAAGAAGLAAEVAAAGAGVSVVACDAASRAGLAGLLGWIGAGGPPLRAVLHAAGVLDDGMLDGLDTARLAGVLAVKSAGAAYLDELTAGAGLDAFVLFSSAAGTLGSAGQGNYAAANAYLDALAQARHARGQAATSVAWGPWADGGLAQSAVVRQRMRRSGLPEMAPELAIQALQQALEHDETLLTVLDADWTRLASGGVRPLLRDLLELAGLAREAKAGAGGPQGELARRLAGLTGAEQRRVLVELVRAEAAAVLGHPSQDAIEAARAFRDLGFDSLTAVELRNRLSAVSGLRLPTTLVFDYPTPVVLADHLRAELTGSQAAVPAAPAVTAAATGEPIAIVAMSCRYPGGAGSPEAFWELIAAGGDAVSGLPLDRGWDVEALYHPDPDHPGTSYAREGSFLDGLAEFDPGFFGISPREALAMDPQQRLLLEVSWEALERAGLDPASLKGSSTGVFTGASYSGYSDGLADGVGGSEGYLVTGNATAVISGRVSYTLGLEGPAVTVDTACSSSLVALHLACQALRSGECTLALAGGVTVMITPQAFTEFARQRGLAADGRCKAFGAAADGIGWSEGAGVVLLERLSDARRLGHPVLAVVRGSAMNQDGASNGLTAPNGPSQQRVIRAALASAQLNAGDVDAVEAHGTGTVLGDPIEAQALLATYGQERSEGRPLWLGSVKSNIGHAQLAAGVAGVIKMVLALRHGVLPATLHAGEPSPHVDWSAGAVRLLTEARPWPETGHPRRAGVSAFGVSGTNVHAILEEAPAGDEADGPATGKPAVLEPGALAWVVSGRTAAGLAAQAGRLGEFAAARPELDPADVGWSLAATRSVFEHRAVITGAGREELAAGLAAIAARQPAPGVTTGVGSDPGQTVFVFPGQGGQWAGMGRELAGTSPVFASRLAECGRALAPHVDWSLDDVLAGADGAPGLDRADVVQPVLWAVMVSLATLWQAAGVTPDAVAGHSQGEIAAACVAGILTLEDAAQVVALRSRALMALAGRGGMLSVAEPAAQVHDRLARWGGRLSVAAVNSPAATVVSGDLDALAELAAQCADAGVRAKVLPVDYASHCGQVERLRAEIVAALAGIAPGPARIPMVSAMTGEVLDGPEAGPRYWYDSLRAPVEFDQAIRVLAASGHRVFIEVSPHPVLAAAITQTCEDTAGTPVTVAGTLRRGDGGAGRFLASLAGVHVGGAAVDWTAVLGAGRRVDLPTYAFQRQRYWPRPVSAPVTGAGAAALGLGATGHPLLGAAVDLAAGADLVLTGRLSVRSQPWLADHAVGGTVLLPGTAFVELAIRAGDQAGCGQVEELTLQAPLVLPADGAVQLQAVVGDPDEWGRRPLEVYCRQEDPAAEGPWTRHASGLLAPVAPADAGLAGEFAIWPPEGAVPADAGGVYEAMSAAGYGYGPAFRGLQAAWRRGGDVFAEVRLPADAAADAGSFGLHPALLDAALHAAGLAADPAPAGTPAGGAVRMPFAWTGVCLHAAGAAALRVRLRRDADGGLSLAAADATGAPVVTVGSLVLRPVPAGQLAAAGGGLQDALFTVTWLPVPAAQDADPAAEDTVAATRWAVIGSDPLGLAEAGADVLAYPDLPALAAALQAGEPAPAVVLACAGSAAADHDPRIPAAAAARRAAGDTLGLLQQWLAAGPLASSRLVILTRGAVATGSAEGVTDLAAAAAAALVRSAQAENPDRLVLIDWPGPDRTDALAALATVLGSGEPELAIRDGVAYARRLARPAAGLLVPPDDAGPWRLDSTERGTLAALALVTCPEAAAPLQAGQVRVAVRAAGLNVSDVMIGLDMYSGAGRMGSEIAGIVTETGPRVTGLAPGDRVLGMADGGFGPVAVTDARLLAPVPASWSFAQAASVPVAFLTAWYALADLAGARAGQRLLVHGAASETALAAVTIGRYLGLEVYGPAGLGLDSDHVAPTADFEPWFLAATGGAGLDIVLNFLAGEQTDAALRLLPHGGRFIEMGTTGIRDAAGVARDHPGVRYQAFDLSWAGPDRLGAILAQVTGLLAAGELDPLPVRAWDVRRAPEAFRFLSQARHAGKVVLTIPPDSAAPREPGTVLVTGGTGTLGALVARHLAGTGRARQVVLASRSGPAAAGVAALAADLAAAGAGVQVAVCDAADRGALAGLLATIPAGCPLTGVIHAAGVVDDGVTGSLTAARVAAVMRPKADAAWHLHELTAGLDLEMFVLFSSVAAVFGGAGQGSYVAANGFLDALAGYRRSRGLPGVSLAWGTWVHRAGIGRNLGEGLLARISRSGIAELAAGEGLALLDLAVGRDEALLVPARLDVAGLRARAAGGAVVPALWRDLIGPAGGPARRAAASASADSGAELESLRGRLAVLPGADRDRVLLDLVRVHVAAVLGHASPEEIEPGRAFSEAGFDSLTAVELRNRLTAATGLRLPATLVFDYPTPALLAAQLRAELLGDQDAAPRTPVPVAVAAAGEPVAVVAMSCRFPGGVRDPEGLWELLAAGGDAISGFPADRGWDLERLYDPDPDHAGTSYAREGGFVTGAADFDPGFFGISPREALAMDPQQRLLLETSWEALERAGIDPLSLHGSPTGVFAGAAYSGYGMGLPEGAGGEGYALTGSATAVISGRVSYVLGLEGPAVTVDTACSSSLVALHLACQALRAGECSLALAGGVMVMASPGEFVGFSRQRGLAADGRCKSFAASADGMGMGEGAGMVVLERLSDARRAGHRVLAVVRGSAVNQDGASNGLTAPNGPSQQRVIRAALASAGVGAGEVDVVEAHGSGTVLGDPIEAQALLATYGQDRPSDQPLWLGSVKSNIGHAQTAAGVAGVIKMVLALQHGVLPATLHAGEPSPHVDWSAGSVRLLTGPVPWPAGGPPRRAGVSAFGFSGTNAHAVLEEAPAGDRELAAAAEPAVSEPVVSGLAWLVSARTAQGLAAQAGRLGEFVAARAELEAADVGWSLATTRSVFEHRAVVTGADREELAAGLAAVAAGQPAAGVVTGAASAAGKTVFVFPGQGGQWAGMGAELAVSSPMFASRLAECGRALARYVDWSLEDVLAGVPGAPGLDRADVVQPVLWAVMVSLAAVWQAAGVTPDAVAGHSQGEIAAACVAGILTLEDAAAVVALRSRALMALAGRGGMVSVAEPAAQVHDRLAGWGGQLSVAAVNSPAATVVSGDPGALAELAAQCAEAGVRAKTVPVDYASHCAQVEELREEILAVLDGITPGPARIPMISAMTGELLDGPEAGAGYWYDSLRAPVEFDQAIRALAASGHRVFIEVSPHPVLAPAITETLEDAAGNAVAGTAAAAAPVVTGTLRRDDGGADRFLASLAAVHVRGTAVDWAAVLAGGRRVDLPTYAFQHQRYWPRPSLAMVAGDVTFAGLGAVGHPLLGAAVELAGGEGLVCTGRLSVQAQPWLADHAVGGTVLLPGTALVELAMRAGDAAGCGQLAELTLETPLVVPRHGAVRLQVTVSSPDASGGRVVAVYSRPADGDAELLWTRHASGLVTQVAAADVAGAGDFAVWPPAGAEPVDVDGLYEAMAAGGYGYGPAFRGLRAAWRRGEDIFAEVRLPADAAADAGSFGLHPALLDAALHASGLAEAAGTGAQPGAGEDTIRLPFAYAGVSLYAAGASALRVRLRRDGDGGLSLAAADDVGAPVVSVGSLVSRPVAAGQLEAGGGGPRDALFGVEWVPVPAEGDAGSAGRWAVVGADALGLGEGLDVLSYPDLAGLVAAGEPVPELVLACAGGGDVPAAGPDVAGAARVAAGAVLGLVQEWLAMESLAASQLVVVTRGAVAAGPGEGVADLAGAAVWGLVRSAQSENPGRVVLADLPAAGGADFGVLAAALGSGKPELAVRGETVYGRRLVRPADGLVPPEGGVPWRLDVTGGGTLDGLELMPCPEAAAPLQTGQVRIAVRATGVNFRDVALSVGLVDPGEARMGGDVAGIVLETGPGVTGLAVGDRVLGLTDGGFGPLAVADARLLVPVPAGWSFAAAASVPAAFLTAWHALVDLAAARPGQRLLVHAAAGGVGMAAVTIAQHMGLEVYGTASPGKWEVLAGRGLDAAHVASSRTADFEPEFLAATGGAGMDIVLNSLAGELTDASLRLLPRGGTFIELGKTDIRDAVGVIRDHPGVSYQVLELGWAGADRLEAILAQVTGLLAAGELDRLPVRAWDVRRAREAFRFMSQARHAGKIVLTIPPDPAAPRDPGTVLVTGGTGTLGALVAGHLARSGRAAELLLASRSGPAAAGVAAVAAGLAAAGAGVRVIACDTADRAALAGLVAGIPAGCPLAGVVHAAGVLDDGVTGSLTPARVDAVMRPKADAAWHLHELTAGADLESFVMFSSASATFGSAGQGNYAAGNAFLDGLACSRRAAGLPAASLAWGLWADASAMTGHLDGADRARMNRDGVGALSAADGLALLDLAMARDEALLVPARLDIAGLRARAARSGDLPPLWHALAPKTPAIPSAGGLASVAVGGAGGADAAGLLRERLAAVAGPDRDRVLADLVRAHVAAVLGHLSPEAVQPERAFTDLGFDSLTALELRNRLNAATGLRLPATLIFDYPTLAAVAAYLRAEIIPAEADGPAPVFTEIDQLESSLSSLAYDGGLRADITRRLQAMLSNWMETQDAAEQESVIEFQSAPLDEVFAFLDEESL